MSGGHFEGGAQLSEEQALVPVVDPLFFPDGIPLLPYAREVDNLKSGREAVEEATALLKESQYSFLELFEAAFHRNTWFIEPGDGMLGGGGLDREGVLKREKRLCLVF